jgi:hypothetical protein
VVSDLRLVNADLLIRAANVTVRRVEVQGGRIITESCSQPPNLLVEDTSVIRAPGQVTRYNDGQVIGDGGFTLRRVKVDGVAEGVRLGNKACGPALIQDSFIRIQKPDVCGDWHGDAVQGYQGPAVTVRHSTIVMGSFGAPPCEGTAAFFYPGSQGNTRADIDGMLAVGGKYYAFRLGTVGSVRGLLLAGGREATCSLLSVWEARSATVDDNFQPTPGPSVPCGG